MSNSVLEHIHQVLGLLVRTFNIYQTYPDKNDPWTVILTAAVFEICSTTDRKKGYSLGQLLFDCGMILLIKNKVDWELICQRKPAKINKDYIRENRHIFDHDYKVRDNVMLTKHTA